MIADLRYRIAQRLSGLAWRIATPAHQRLEADARRRGFAELNREWDNEALFREKP